MRTSKKVETLLYDPKGMSSEADMVIREVEKLERYMNAFKEVVRPDNEVPLNIEKMPEDKKKIFISAWKKIFRDFPDGWDEDDEEKEEDEKKRLER